MKFIITSYPYRAGWIIQDVNGVEIGYIKEIPQAGKTFADYLINLQNESQKLDLWDEIIRLFSRACRDWENWQISHRYNLVGEEDLLECKKILKKATIAAASEKKGRE